MGSKMRLGPIAIFLAVVAIVLTVLATLTIATSNADVVLAERFASVTQIRYELEKEGNKFLFDLSEQLSGGNTLSTIQGLKKTDNGFYEYGLEQDGYELIIRLAESGTDLYSLEEWKITKVWAEEDLNQGIWLG